MGERPVAEGEQRICDEIARQALARYDDPTTELPMPLSMSENATYLVEGSSQRTVLRVHRDGYHSRNQIESELTWSEAMRQAGVVDTAAVIRSRTGDRVEAVSTIDGSAWRHCVMFEFLDGDEPAADAIVDEFERLGTVTARMHRFTRSWKPPKTFDRMVWNYDTILGATPHWGRWQDGLGVEGAGAALLGRAAQTIRGHLDRFGVGPDRFGLIHADMRLANLIVNDTATNDTATNGSTGATGSSRTNVIDFDDCGFSWYMYDLAASLSFIENRSDVDDAIDRWIDGYRQVMPLSAADIAIIPTMIMMRRILLVAWLGSHPSADLASEMGRPFTDVTYTLAERYLSEHG